jgi:hypothetical protein
MCQCNKTGMFDTDIHLHSCLICVNDHGYDDITQVSCKIFEPHGFSSRIQQLSS